MSNRTRRNLSILPVVLLSVVEGINNLWPNWRWIIWSRGAALVLTVLAGVVAWLEKNEAGRLDRSLAITGLLQGVVILLTDLGAVRLRAGIMLPDGHGAVKVAYALGDDFSDPEREMRWEKGQGPPGNAYLHPRDFHVAVLDTADHSSFESFHSNPENQKLGFTEAQWRLAKDLSVMVAIPVVHGGKVAAVVYIDEKGPSASSPLPDTAKKEYYKSVAESVAMLFVTT